MLLLEAPKFLCSQYLKIIANQAARIFGADDVVDKAALCRYHGIGEAFDILGGVLFHILADNNRDQSLL